MMVKGKKASLINKGAKIDDEIKRLTAELKKVKEKLNSLEPGSYLTKEGRAVTISETVQFTDMDPIETKNALKAKRLGKRFYECVKVNVSCIKRYLSDTELNKLREAKGTSRRYCFK